MSQPRPYSIHVSGVSITVCDIACAVCEKEREEKDLVMPFMLLFMIKSVVFFIAVWIIQMLLKAYNEITL